MFISFNLKFCCPYFPSYFIGLFFSFWWSLLDDFTFRSFSHDDARWFFRLILTLYFPFENAVWFCVLIWQEYYDIFSCISAQRTCYGSTVKTEDLKCTPFPVFWSSKLVVSFCKGKIEDGFMGVHASCRWNSRGLFRLCSDIENPWIYFVATAVQNWPILPIIPPVRRH